MPNIVTLHKRQLFLPTGAVARYARVSFCENHTSSLVSVYSDPAVSAEFERSQPVICDVYGVMPVCYLPTPAAIRIIATDEHDVPLDGYPMDDITPEPTDTSGADSISFTPSTEVPETNVQDAIEHVATLATTPVAETTLVWTTGGTGNAYTLTPTPPLTLVLAGAAYWIRPDRANTGASTLDVSGLGTRPIRKTDTSGVPVAITSGEFQPYRETLVAYDGSVWRVLARRDDAISGSDVNGRWDRFSNGLMICVGSLDLPYNGPASCAASWTYPGGPFINPPSYVSCQIVGGSSPLTPATDADLTVAIPIQDIGAPLNGPRTSNGTVFRVYRTGTANFGETDVLYSVVTAMGRWK